MRSLRARLFVVWALSLAAAVAVGSLLLQLQLQSSQASQARAAVIAQQACERIADRYATYTAGWPGPSGTNLDAATRRDLSAILALALGPQSGTQAGIWHDGEGIVASLPSAALLTASERAAVADSAESAASEDAAREQTLGASVLLRACPLSGPVAELAAWVRVAWAQTRGPDPLSLGMGVLLTLVLGNAGWIAWLIRGWDRQVGTIEAALVRQSAPGEPPLGLSGEPSLDRIVAALNAAGLRLAETRAETEILAARAVKSERLAALGRVAAGVAHEMRNPLAAMRLRAENAQYGDARRKDTALATVLVQIGRLDHLAGELLTMTQPREARTEMVDVPAFLAELAADAGDGISTETTLAQVCFDPALLRRALANLLDNARRHAGAAGRVTLRAARHGAALRFIVTDTGGGVRPDLRATVFEPFVTGRAEGTGLGLAIARELAAAHGGTLRLADPGGDGPDRDTVFVLEVPWHGS